ncbi:MAG: HU family DNA-binding protein [Proteobacteria bacterium]|nr:HU family DNA-binding protein [Pseudomonadota bacterium]
MNKSELIAAMAEVADISNAAAGKALDGMMGAVSGSLAKGDKVSLIGFGTFSVTKRAARDGRNPQTGKTIKIAAKNVAKFKPGTKLADAVN